MSKLDQYILTTCQTSLQWSACLWDYNTGNSLQIYKNGGSAAPKTLNLLGNDYIMFAEQNKPLLHVWPVNSQEQIKNVRLILPEPAKVVAVCPNNIYLAVGLGLKLYVWQINSGKLLTVQQKHFQPITCIKFSNTSEHLVVTGKDGMLVTYRLGDLVSLQTGYLPQNQLGQVEPLYSKMDHTLPITDIHLGSFGSQSRLVTVSNDQTCRIYNLETGEQLLNLIFSEALTAVAVDKTCSFLFVGTSKGVIQQFILKNPPRTIDHHINEAESRLTFVGHTKKVTCLATDSISDDYLASGSDDFKVIVWDRKSRQILRSIEHKESITNILFVNYHRNFSAQDFNPKVCLKTLERSLSTDSTEFVVSLNQTDNIAFKDEFEDRTTKTEKNDYNDLVVINKQLYTQLRKLTEKLHSSNK